MKKAVLTYVYSDIPFIDVWLRHYTRHFEDIIILNLSGKNILDKYKGKYKFMEIVKNLDPIYKNPVVLDILEGMVGGLLADHEWVLYSDIDEIVFPNPSLYTSFEHYIEKMNQPYLYCTAYEVLHEEEPPIDWESPLLMQREYWIRQTTYDKPILTSVNLDWVEGMHDIKGHDDPKQGILPRGDQELLLVHIHRIDNDVVRNYSKRDIFQAKTNMKQIPLLLKTTI